MIKAISSLFLACLFYAGGALGVDSMSVEIPEMYKKTPPNLIKRELERKREEERIQLEEELWKNRIIQTPFDNTLCMTRRSQQRFNKKLIKQADEDGITLSRFNKESLGVSSDRIRWIYSIYTPSIFPMARFFWAEESFGIYMFSCLCLPLPFFIDVFATPILLASHGCEWVIRKKSQKKPVEKLLYESLLMVQLQGEDLTNPSEGSVSAFLLQKAENEGRKEIVSERLITLREHAILSQLYWDDLCWFMEMDLEKWGEFQRDFSSFISNKYKMSYCSLFVKKRGELTEKDIKYLGK